MKILHRYLRNHVVAMTALVMLVLIGVEMFVVLLNELDDIGRGSYGIGQAFVHVLATLPQTVYPLFPVAALIGCLIGLGKLASSSQLTVMQAAGLSKAQIAGSILRTTVLMLLVMTFIGEALAPSLMKFAEQYKSYAQTGTASSTARQGVWLRDGENFLHVEQVLPSNQLVSILRYQFSGQQLRSVSWAKQGTYQQGQWVFSDIKESVIDKDRITTQHFDTQTWPVTLDPKLVGMAAVAIDQASLPALYHYINYLQDSGLSSQAYAFAFWKRLLQPLTALVMIGLAIPFIFGSLRTTTMGVRILVGVIVGFGFYTLNEFLGPFSLVYQVPPFLAAAVPMVLFTAIDAWLLLRAGRHS